MNPTPPPAMFLAPAWNLLSRFASKDPMRTTLKFPWVAIMDGAPYLIASDGRIAARIPLKEQHEPGYVPSPEWKPVQGDRTPPNIAQLWPTERRWSRGMVRAWSQGLALKLPKTHNRPVWLLWVESETHPREYSRLTYAVTRGCDDDCPMMMHEDHQHRLFGAGIMKAIGSIDWGSPGASMVDGCIVLPSSRDMEILVMPMRSECPVQRVRAVQP